MSLANKDVASIILSSIQRMEKVCMANGTPYFTDGSIPFDQADYSSNADEREGQEGYFLLHIEDALGFMDRHNLESALEVEFETELSGASIRQWLESVKVKRNETIVGS